VTLLKKGAHTYTQLHVFFPSNVSSQDLKGFKSNPISELSLNSQDLSTCTIVAYIEERHSWRPYFSFHLAFILSFKCS